MKKQTINYQGAKFILGLHGVPDYYKNSKHNKPEDWYWAQGSKKEDNRFLPSWDESLQK